MVKDNTHEPDRERERFPYICGTALNQKKKGYPKSREWAWGYKT